nr:hypothetical protein [Tanacetum cinerariifolium]
SCITKPKASARRTRSSPDTSITHPTAAACPRLTASAKGKQTAKASKAKKSICPLCDEGTGSIPGVTDAPTDESEEVLSWKFTNDEGVDDKGKDGDDDEEDEGDDGEEGDNINQRRGIQANLEVKDSHVTLTPVNPDGVESTFETTSQTDVQTPTFVAPLLMTAPTMTPSTIATITTTSQRLNEAVKVVVQIQSDSLRDEAQRENDEFLKTVDENMNLYKALVEAYESDKIILDTYGEIVTLKRRRDDDANKDEEPSARPDRGSKRRREGKKPESASAPTETATKSAGRSTQGFDTGAEDQQIVQSSQHPEWFSQQQKPSSLDCDWNKTVPAVHRSIQPWIREFVKQSDSHSSLYELMDTPLDFSNFLINRLKVDTLTLKVLASPTYELMKGSCKSLVKLEYHLEEVFKATTNQLDWVNPEGLQYPHNLLKPLQLIPNNRGLHVIPFEHFINNDLEYLCGGASSRKYTTSIMKTKAADYEHIKWIEDLVPRTMWIEEPIGYDKHALWESPIGGVNVNSSMILLLTGSLLMMCIPREESSLSLNSGLYSGIATSTWIG